MIIRECSKKFEANKVDSTAAAAVYDTAYIPDSKKMIGQSRTLSQCESKGSQVLPDIYIYIYTSYLWNNWATCRLQQQSTAVRIDLAGIRTPPALLREQNRLQLAVGVCARRYPREGVDRCIDWGPEWGCSARARARAHTYTHAHSLRSTRTHSLRSFLGHFR